MNAKMSKSKGHKDSTVKSRATKQEVKEATQRGVKHYLNALKELSRR